MKINNHKPLYVEIKQEIMNQCIGGHNCNFDYDDVLTNVTYISNDDNTYKLYTEIGECPSGWTTATWGVCENVDYNVNAQYKIDDYTVEYEEYDEDVFIRDTTGTKPLITISKCGNDDWYPSGFVSVDDLTQYMTGRGTKRKIYIVSGLPNIGKSSLLERRKDVLELDTLERGKIWICNYLEDYTVFVYSTTRNSVTTAGIDTDKYDIVYVNMVMEEK